MKLYKARTSNGTIETINAVRVEGSWYWERDADVGEGKFPMETPKSKCFYYLHEAREWLVNQLTSEFERERAKFKKIEQKLKEAKAL